MASRTATKPMNRSLIHDISHPSRTAGRVSMKLRGRNEGEVQPEKAVYPILNHCCALQNKNAPSLTQARRVENKSPMVTSAAVSQVLVVSQVAAVLLAAVSRVSAD